MGGAQKKSGGPKKIFPALCAGNGPPTFNLLPTPLSSNTAVTAQSVQLVDITSSVRCTVYPIKFRMNIVC